MGTRVAFLVDGFNLYHSLEAASRQLDGAPTKWLDVPALCRGFLPQIGGGAHLEAVHYFTSPANHVEQVKPGAIERHAAYVRALRACGVHVELGKFKEKWRTCPACGERIVSHEEKETDVAIAVRFMQLLWRDRCDCVVLLSADSDLSPAIREASHSFPDVPVDCCFPFARGSQELKSLARRCYRIRKERYLRHQLPDVVALPDGARVRRPEGW